MKRYENIDLIFGVENDIIAPGIHIPAGSFFYAEDSGVLYTNDGAIFTPVAGETSVTASVAAAYEIDWNESTYWDITMTADTTFTESNIPSTGQGKTIAIRLTGDFTPTVPSEWNVDLSSYDGTVSNLITIASFGTTEHFGALNVGS